MHFQFQAQYSHVQGYRPKFRYVICKQYPITQISVVAT